MCYRLLDILKNIFIEIKNKHILDISSIQLLNNIEAISIHITQAVRSWYSYTYDGIQAYTISDGGRDMFDGGNIVS